MANNRMYLFAVNDDGIVQNEIVFAKHLGGEWYTACDNEEDFVKAIDDFLFNAFADGWGISLKDEYMETALPPLWHYNDKIEKGTWIFVPKTIDGSVVRYGK